MLNRLSHHIFRQVCKYRFKKVALTPSSIKSQEGAILICELLQLVRISQALCVGAALIEGTTNKAKQKWPSPTVFSGPSQRDFTLHIFKDFAHAYESPLTEAYQTHRSNTIFANFLADQHTHMSAPNLNE
jgi:hypothetical protein